MKTEDILVVIRDLYSGLYRGNKVIVKEVPPVGWNIVKIYKVSDQKKIYNVYKHIIGYIHQIRDKKINKILYGKTTTPEG